MVLDDQYSPSVLTADEQAKLQPWEDWMACERCLAFTLPRKRTFSSRLARFLVSLFSYSWSLQFHKQGCSLHLSMRDKTFSFVQLVRAMAAWSLFYILSATRRCSPPISNMPKVISASRRSRYRDYFTLLWAEPRARRSTFVSIDCHLNGRLKAA